MNKPVDYLELTFENIEWVRIPARYIKEFRLDDAGGQACVSLSLTPEADGDSVGFACDVHIIRFGNGRLFERLRRNDITQINLIYADSSEKCFHVRWEDWEENEYVNRFQTTYVDGNGFLCIRIGA